jgi:hypothetical protein
VRIVAIPISCLIRCPEVLPQQVRSSNLPDQTAAWQPKLQHWADLITSGRAEAFKESELLPDLLTEIFCSLLGCTGLSHWKIAVRKSAHADSRSLAACCRIPPALRRTPRSLRTTVC